ncbi:MAG: M14 family zinc carboxypeptidase, partial [Bacteroidota bacterium]
MFAQIPVPEEHFGFKPGSDRNMFLYEDLVSYMKILADESPMVHWEEIGETELGKPMYCFFISSAENIKNLERLRTINQQLAFNDIPADTNLEELKKEGKVFFLSTLSMHANEVGPVQALPLVAYELLTGDDKRRQAILENTVAMFLPHNPDGMSMIVEHYNKHKGTALETSNLPGVYHKYVGHNINRDFVTLHMSENKAVAEVYSTRWFPQAMVERHQMQSTGARFFVSPPHDPIAENVDSEVWNWMRIYGSRALREMTDAGLEGISVNYLFDDYWPGHTSTSKWKGVVGMLSEGASVGIATPVFIEENEIRFIGKGISENEVSINMPKPWKGGWWKLSDLMNYELENTMSYLHTSAIHKEEILEFRNNLTRREIKRGKEEAPYFYILPLEQHDQSELAAIANLLSEHGVKVYQLNDNATIGKRNFRKGDIVVPLAQPYRAFIKEILEVQKFPARHYTPGGELIKPYDITTWSLPLHRSVEAVEINEAGKVKESMFTRVELPFTMKTTQPQQSDWALFSSGNNESYKAAFASLKKGWDVERTSEPYKSGEKIFPAGSFLIKTTRKFNELEEELLISPLYLTNKPEGLKTEKISMPRIGIVETWIHDMDGGWTRFIFDQYHIDYKIIRPAELQSRDLNKEFDILVFTDREKSVYMQGKFKRNDKPVPMNYPPEFAKGMEKKGFE